jgi:hypothetical protein
MINKTIKALMTLIAISSLSSFAYAGSFGIGVSGNIASVSADGTETETANTGTENSVQTATAGNDFAFGSIFAEYNFGDSERFTLGVDWIPGTADVNSKTISRTDVNSDANESNLQAGTRSANAEISDHVTYYAELGIAGGVYAKAGFAQVDIKTKENSTITSGSATVGSYPDKTLDAWTYGLGYKGTFGTNGFYKVEGYAIDYDTYSASSGTGNTVTANLDVVGAALKLGYKF